MQTKNHPTTPTTPTAHLLLHNRPNGMIFSVPARNVLVQNIAVGDVVTFSFEKYAHKKEFFINPIIYQLRTDLSWEDVVANAIAHLEPFYPFSFSNQKTCVATAATKTPHHLLFTKKPFCKTKKNAQRRWTEESMRLFLEDVARKYNMEPTNPDTWKKLSATTIIEEVGHSLLCSP